MEAPASRPRKAGAWERAKAVAILEEKGRVIGFETRFYRQDGQIIWVSINNWKVNDREGNLLYYEGTIVDITERKQAEENIRKYQEELEDLVRERTAELTEANEKLSAAVEEQKEYSRELTMLNQMSDMLHECRDEKETYGVVADVCAGLFPLDSGHLSIADKKRGRLSTVAAWGESKISNPERAMKECIVFREKQKISIKGPGDGPGCPFLDPCPDFGYICLPLTAQGEMLGIFHIAFENPGKRRADEVYRNKIESKRLIAVRIAEHYALSLSNLRLRETLRLESIHDPLTGLYNRRYMEKTLEREVSRAERGKSPIGIIMIDIDHFKTFNDTYGHKVGDTVLRNLGDYLKQRIRKEDIACRYGGEEFTLIIPGLTARETGKRAEMLRRGIKEDLKLPYDGEILSITVSMGVAAYPENGPTIKETQRLSDLALYRAKDNGRDQVVVV